MSKDVIIVNDKVANTFIDEFGNIKINEEYKSFLFDYGKGKISKDYYDIRKYDDNSEDDLYIVKDVLVSNDLSCLLKEGIIKLHRDFNGEICSNEEVIVPIIYDKIIYNNSYVATAYANDNHMTYIDINPKSKNYKKQLVPAILDHAAPFDLEYPGFAECSINGIVGYLPYNCEVKNEFSSNLLLTEMEVEYLLSFINNPIQASAINKYYELNGRKRVLDKRN